MEIIPNAHMVTILPFTHFHQLSFVLFCKTFLAKDSFERLSIIGTLESVYDRVEKGVSIEKKLNYSMTKV